jgi:hypothetical protein
MSYQQYRQDEYQGLNEQRKREILRELHDEMDKLKVKYMLDEKKENKKLSQIKSLDSLESSLRVRRYSEDDADRVTIEERAEEKSLKNDKEINKMQQTELLDNNTNFLNQNSNPLNVSQLRQSQAESIKEEMNSRESYEMLDKAKQNLLKIKNDLDDLDQYDYKNRIYQKKEDFNFACNPYNYENFDYQQKIDNQEEDIQDREENEEFNNNHIINTYNKKENDIDE